MNRKTIRLKLRNKFEDWLGSIEDESVRKLVEQNTIITGGCIASLLLGEKVNDFDVYFRNKETVKAIATYYVDRFNHEQGLTKNQLGYEHKAFVLDGAGDLKQQVKKAGYASIWNSDMLRISEDRIKIIVRSDGVAGALPDPEEVLERGDDIPADATEEEGYKPVFLSSNAITLSNKVQLVIRFYGEPNEIHENYDFVHCTNYWEPWPEELVTNAEALESLLSKTLFYMGSKYPLCSVIRTRKFLKQGWHINAGQYLKMLFQVSELDLTDTVTLEDQLIGVDTMYFMMLIKALEEQKEKNAHFAVDASYIASLVDRIFG